MWIGFGLIDELNAVDENRHVARSRHRQIDTDDVTGIDFPYPNRGILRQTRISPQRGLRLPCLMN